MPETKTLIYEWDAEEWSGPPSDPEAECLEHYHRETFAEVMAAADQLKRGGAHVRVVLVRDDTTDGGRTWAYLGSPEPLAPFGALPTEFTAPDETGFYDSTGVRVPQRFHAEVARYTKEAAR